MRQVIKKGEVMNVYVVKITTMSKYLLTLFTYAPKVYALSDLHILHLRKEV
ncbi:hypothetical protein Cst_c03570 [Thermoclostridium stercorarium subsp. stercorarium DSM 8532]|uniref:Uncharacterized protein n=1 Tax=Thermoclostridium stercorarium (strain ATCC 35414 / DSM 8532 / NCIMB 11754) TaxID=1121335 RepID=L7VLK6_THES1|nr:hypothetical protein [Thermoclostridium stercorarium]AGC67381.1 hypothetical protein Cst_c03570 [Thermoclostridium stercorarium subsp. stercorarium DSM 8532]